MKICNKVLGLVEKSIVNDADIKRLVVLIKKSGKVNYKNKEYTAKISPSIKFIELLGKGGKLEKVPVSDVKSYTLAGDVVVIKT